MREKIEGIKDWLVEVRRTIHRNPELGFEEVETSKLVGQYLEQFGLQVRKGVARTGVVGILRGDQPGKTIAIRADMDALPLDEANEIPYRSNVPGKMHACGHDAHVAILLGVARLFSSIRGQVRGSIKFVFQPAEEGGGGGKVMVQEGVLENPRVDAVFAAHVFPNLAVGKVGIHEREGLAATDRFTIRIVGQGGHGAYPHLCNDPIVAAAHLVTQIQSIVSRNVNPLESGVVTVGGIHGGTGFNIIPQEVELIGTVRSLTARVREILKARLEEITRGVGHSFGVQTEFHFHDGYPALINDPQMSRLVASVCADGFGNENVEFLQPTMGGEDFAYFLQKVPGAFFRLGCRNESRGIVHPGHSPFFQIDEAVLPIGVEVFMRIIDRYLELNLF